MKLDNELQHRIFAGAEFHNLAPQYAKLCLLLSVRTVGRRRTMILSGINCRELRLVCGIAVNSECRAGIWFGISILHMQLHCSAEIADEVVAYQGDSTAIHCQLTGTIPHHESQVYSSV